MSALNAFASKKAVVFVGEEEERVRCEMDQRKTTKDHHYQQRKDVLLDKDVTLDTSHWLMSALNPVAALKAVVFGRRKKKCKTG